MSVLFSEISADLGLSLVQIGIVWGIGSLPMIVSSLLAGGIIDRFGPRRVLQYGVIVIGLTGALRGFSNNFGFLVFTVILMGMFTPVVTMSGIKLSRLWFPPHQLGASGGILSMGMALGFFLSSMFSATLLSPWLGGWRNVFFFYGVLTAVLCIPWFLSPQSPIEPARRSVEDGGTHPGFFQSIAYIASKPNSWLFAVVAFALTGSVQAMLGYLPTYLKNSGWEAASADGALATFHLVSMLFVMPLAFLSDRFRSRKVITAAMMVMLIVGIGALGFVNGPWVWVAVIISGMVRDGFMAVYLAMVINAEGIGHEHVAIATGFNFIFSGLGNMLMPALGNNIAESNPGLAFAFWAACGVVGLIAILLVKERRTAVN
jgi:NNP family nitrate/nitrite transporter-like MFS transporter